MADSTHYAVRGGVEGRERLRVIGRVMHPSSSTLLDRLALCDGLACLDVGCGGGDAALEIARRVAPSGHVVGLDIDAATLELARTETAHAGVRHVTFAQQDIREAPGTPEFDVVYSRFLLTHLSDPAGVLAAFYQYLRPGGVVAVEDIDFSGSFTYPESRAFRRYQELYCAAVERRGGDPNIGPRLPGLLKICGFQRIGVAMVQPIGTQGEAKLVTPLTMENIVDAVLDDGLATRDETDELLRELYEFAADPDTVAGMPRVVQAWGYRPLNS